MSEAVVRELVARLLADHRPGPGPEFWGAQYDAGLAWVWAPEGEGGLGLNAGLQVIVDEALLAAGATRPFLVNPIGMGMGAPTVLVHGSAEQRRRWLRPMFTGAEIWCQLFSEPGAGSDLASLSTRAVRDGDTWVVNGQKVWTSVARRAVRGLLVARTDPDVPKHEGLTYFGLDMTAPGVEIRPLRQMTGSAEFNEVYFTDVVVPDADRIDEVGAGWSVVRTMLGAERMALGGAMAPRAGGPIEELLRVWRELPAERRDPALRDRVVAKYVEFEAFALTAERVGRSARLGEPGPDGGVLKIAMAQLNQTVYELCLDILGPAAMLYPGGYDLDAGAAAVGESPDVRVRFLRARANSIEGGTSEIVRNTLGERVLGLPRDPSADRGKPWSEVPRS